MRITVIMLITAVIGCDPEPKTEPDPTPENSAPTADILSPEYGENVPADEAVEFVGVAGDAESEPDALTVTWFSSIDGDLSTDVPDEEGYSTFTADALSIGAHTISMTVTDSSSATAEHSILINVFEAGLPPTILSLTPDSTDSAVEGDAVELIAEVEDLDDAFDALTVKFEVESIDQYATCTATPGDNGSASCVVVLEADTVSITATVTDPLGQTDTRTNEGFKVISEDLHDGDGDGYSEADGDCDDAHDGVHPAAVELADGLDNDCDGTIDEETDDYDDDGDTFSELEGDCNDEDPDVFPGAPEFADGIDQDCDGAIDNGTEAYDDDGDCFCEGSDLIDICAGSIAADCLSDDLTTGDCDDADEDLNPGAVELCDSVDNDCDGATDAADTDTDGDGDGFSACGGADCNDGDPDINPDATEVCNDVDDDCDGAVDEAGALGAPTWWADSDGDDYGNPSASVASCERPAGYSDNAEDCNDSNAAIHPGATEVCDSDDTDENCDGSADGYDAAGRVVYHWDGDEDGYAPEEVAASTGVAATRTLCDPEWKYTIRAPVTEWDCDDTRDDINPGMDEVCDPFDLDENCNGTAEEAGATDGILYYRDFDGDGFGDPLMVEELCDPDTIEDYNVTNNDDCCDYDPVSKPDSGGDEADYRTIPNACGSYDWNCDSVDEKKWTRQGSCSDYLCSTTKGWRYSTDPECGESDSWLEDCDRGFSISCSKDYIPKTQECR